MIVRSMLVATGLFLGSAGFAAVPAEPAGTATVSPGDDGSTPRPIRIWVTGKPAALDKASEQLNSIKDAKCRITNLRPGWIQTERIEKFDIREPKISLQELVLLVNFLLDLQHKLHISTMSMTAREV